MSCGILGRLERIANGLLKTADAIVDDRKTKKDVLKGLLDVGKNSVGLGFQVTGCAIKNAPKAVKTMKEIKNELTNEIKKTDQIEIDRILTLLEDKNDKKNR